jgi:hypothetical protein
MGKDQAIRVIKKIVMALKQERIAVDRVILFRN